MKTTANNTNLIGLKTQTAILILTIIALFSGIRSAAGATYQLPAPDEETYINDIPFDTHDIAVGYFLDKALAEIKLCEEAEIMDIPFNTAIIAGLHKEHVQNAIRVVLKENVVDDIPFDTHEIVQHYRFSQIGEGLLLKPESSVNDIPFETALVLTDHIQEKKSSTEIKFFNKLPEHLMPRLVNLIKAILVSSLILLSASVIGFLFFSYVY
jgi:hypothetical protein